MSDPYWLTEGGHVLISGPTGSGKRYGGKSATANWWSDNLLSKGWVDVSIALDFGGAGYEGLQVSSLREMAEAYRRGTRQFVYVGDASEAVVNNVVEFADRLPGRKAIVFDEAWMFAEAEGLIDSVRNLGNQADPITSIVVSQRAWDVPDSIRNSIPLKVWVGPITEEGRRFLQVSGMGSLADRLEGRVDPYHWVVTDGGEFVDYMAPVPEEYA